MPERTQKQIEAEILALEGCKAYAPHYTKFGDDNHHGIDLQIEYLRGDIDTTAGEWDDYTNDEKSTILEAQCWKEGEEKESPSSGWDRFLKPND